MPEGELTRQGERELMSMNLTCAYPTRIGLESYQRTLMLLRPEGEVRLVENITFREPQTAVFRFVCAEEPELTRDTAREAGMRISAEGDFRVRTVAEEDGRYALEYELIQPVRSGIFSFGIEKEIQ